MKSNKKKKGIGGTIKYLIMILVISAVLAGSGILLCNDLFALAKPDKDITVTIPEDASVSEVSKLLDKSGVINYGSFFHLFTSTVYKDIQFRPGMWTLNSDMDYREIINQIRLTSKSTVTVTIPEGYTVNDIIDTLVKNGLSSKQELQSAMQNDTFNYDFLPDDLGNQTNRLEGYLFPDTYEFYLSDSADTIINKMLGNFENKLNSTSDGKSLTQICKEKNLDVSDMVIIASITQKESVNADDMYNVSSVIHNRLNNAAEYPYLNMDTTVVYAVGHKNLTKADLKSDSPYNTYTSKGLPPGPICNPGMDALKAAASPNQTDYYYFVADDAGTKHLYAKTLAEHNKNIAQLEAEAAGN